MGGGGGCHNTPPPRSTSGSLPTVADLIRRILKDEPERGVGPGSQDTGSDADDVAAAPPVGALPRPPLLSPQPPPEHPRVQEQLSQALVGPVVAEPLGLSLVQGSGLMAPPASTTTPSGTPPFPPPADPQVQLVTKFNAPSSSYSQDPRFWSSFMGKCRLAWGIFFPHKVTALSPAAAVKARLQMVSAGFQGQPGVSYGGRV